jgi:ABC-type transport system involved in multi-copper enzyme maturation permease subunit
MRSTLSLIRREFTAYFWSPVAYVVFGTFLLGTGWLFHMTLDKLTARGPVGTEFPMQEMLGTIGFWLIFWVIPPLLTMRLFAEERSTGTLEMLMTAPLKDWQVVLAKFIACFLFFLLLLVPTLAYLPVLLDLHVTGGWLVEAIRGWSQGTASVPPPPLTVWSVTLLAGLALLVIGLVVALAKLGFTAVLLLLIGAVATGVGIYGHYWAEGEPKLLTLTAGIDPMPVLISYVGLILAGAMFLAIGMWMSSLVRSQMVAALISLALSSVFLLGGLLTLSGTLPPPSDTGVLWNRLLVYFSVPLHFSRDFARGIIDTRHVVLYLSATLACLFLTVRSLESRRWG